MSFNLDRIFEPDPLKHGILTIPFLEGQMKLVSNLKNLGLDLNTDAIQLFYSEKSFNAFSFVLFVLEHLKCVEELIIITYSISKKVLDTLDFLFGQGMIDKCMICVSDSIKFRMPNVYERLLELSKKYPHFYVKLKWVHAKVSLIKKGDKHYVIEGSGNSTMNAGIEQYLFVDNEAIFNFRKKIIWTTSF